MTSENMTHLSLRVPEGTVTALDAAADEYEMSRSALVRSILADAIDSDTEVFDSLPLEAKREVWKREAKPKQHRAWFRSNVKNRMYKCWNSGLSSEEMKMDMHGRIQEAEEYGREEWLEQAITVYEQARAEEDFQMLRAFFDTRMVLEESEQDAEQDDRPAVVTKSEQWRCQACGDIHSPSSEPWESEGFIGPLLIARPPECSNCGSDTFDSIGETVTKPLKGSEGE